MSPTTGQRAERRGVPLASARGFLRTALLARRAADERCVVLLPGPATPPTALGPSGRPPTVLFGSADRATIVGWDVAAAITREDHDLDAVRHEAERILRNTTLTAHPDLPEETPGRVPWVGGHSFTAGPRHDPAWTAFPPVCFVVPRWTYRAADGMATLALALGPEDHADVPELIEEYTSLATGASPIVPRPPSRPPVLGLGAEERDRWIDGVRAALRAIERGELSKVVLARHLDLTLAHGDGIEAARALEDLTRRFPTCTRFLLSRDGADFFGATPETLIERAGHHVRAEAMAGSCRPGEEAALAKSPKDVREHALVVEDILARLRPFCAALEASPVPAVRRFANIAHLWTPVRGRLERSAHVLDLVGSLHPTPAVAGTPRDAAVALLERTEAADRGWFAGPFGWFDATGDGHFVVALRSCLRHADGVRLYAGAGIVRGSDPAWEFDETVLKMRAVLDTLYAITDEPADRVG